MAKQQPSPQQQTISLQQQTTERNKKQLLE
jgi:hypothetical protein